jgi:hypothetical protein
MCETLSRFDAAFQAPRALWEFQLFRRGFGCKVPDFDDRKYSTEERLQKPLP